MKKRTYKRLQNRLYREIKARIRAEQRISDAEERAYKAEADATGIKKRFMEFGSNVETIKEGAGSLKIVQWEMPVESYGTYMAMMFDAINYHRRHSLLITKQLVEKLVEGLLMNNLVQIIYNEGCKGDPLQLPTVAAKLFVVPWDKVPYTRTLALAQLAKEEAEK